MRKKTLEKDVSALKGKLVLTPSDGLLFDIQHGIITSPKPGFYAVKPPMGALESRAPTVAEFGREFLYGLNAFLHGQTSVAEIKATADMFMGNLAPASEIKVATDVVIDLLKHDLKAKAMLKLLQNSRGKKHFQKILLGFRIDNELLESLGKVAGRFEKIVVDRIGHSLEIISTASKYYESNGWRSIVLTPYEMMVRARAIVILTGILKTPVQYLLGTAGVALGVKFSPVVVSGMAVLAAAALVEQQFNIPPVPKRINTSPQIYAPNIIQDFEASLKYFPVSTALNVLFPRPFNPVLIGEDSLIRDGFPLSFEQRTIGNSSDSEVLVSVPLAVTRPQTQAFNYQQAKISLIPMDLSLIHISMPSVPLVGATLPVTPPRSLELVYANANVINRYEAQRNTSQGLETRAGTFSLAQPNNAHGYGVQWESNTTKQGSYSGFAGIGVGGIIFSVSGPVTWPIALGAAAGAGLWFLGEKFVEHQQWKKLPATEKLNRAIDEKLTKLNQSINKKGFLNTWTLGKSWDELNNFHKNRLIEVLQEGLGLYPPGHPQRFKCFALLHEVNRHDFKRSIASEEAVSNFTTHLCTQMNTIQRAAQNNQMYSVKNQIDDMLSYMPGDPQLLIYKEFQRVSSYLYDSSTNKLFTATEDMVQALKKAEAENGLPAEYRRVLAVGSYDLGVKAKNESKHYATQNNLEEASRQQDKSEAYFKEAVDKINSLPSKTKQDLDYKNLAIFNSEASSAAIKQEARCHLEKRFFDDTLLVNAKRKLSDEDSFLARNIATSLYQDDLNNMDIVSAIVHLSQEAILSKDPNEKLELAKLQAHWADELQQEALSHKSDEANFHKLYSQGLQERQKGIQYFEELPVEMREEVSNCVYYNTQRLQLGDKAISFAAKLELQNLITKIDALAEPNEKAQKAAVSAYHALANEALREADDKEIQMNERGNPKKIKPEDIRKCINYAIACQEKALARPVAPTAEQYTELGKLYLRLWDTKKAKENYKHSLEMKPDDNSEASKGLKCASEVEKHQRSATGRMSVEIAAYLAHYWVTSKFSPSERPEIANGIITAYECLADPFFDALNQYSDNSLVHGFTGNTEDYSYKKFLEDYNYGALVRAVLRTPGIIRNNFGYWSKGNGKKTVDAIECADTLYGYYDYWQSVYNKVEGFDPTIGAVRMLMRSAHSIIQAPKINGDQAWEHSAAYVASDVFTITTPGLGVYAIATAYAAKAAAAAKVAGAVATGAAAAPSAAVVATIALSLTAAAAVGTVGYSYCTGSYQNALLDDKKHNAEYFLRNNKPEEAAKKLREYLQIKPDDLEVQSRLRECEIMTCLNSQEIVSRCTDALKLIKDDSLLYRRAIAYRKEGYHHLAEQDLRQLSENPEACCELSGLAQSRGDFYNARLEYDKAADLLTEEIKRLKEAIEKAAKEKYDFSIVEKFYDFVKSSRFLPYLFHDSFFLFQGTANHRRYVKDCQFKEKKREEIYQLLIFVEDTTKALWARCADDIGATIANSVAQVTSISLSSLLTPVFKQSSVQSSGPSSITRRIRLSHQFFGYSSSSGRRAVIAPLSSSSCLLQAQERSDLSDGLPNTRSLANPLASQRVEAVRPSVKGHGFFASQPTKSRSWLGEGRTSLLQSSSLTFS